MHSIHFYKISKYQNVEHELEEKSVSIGVVIKCLQIIKIFIYNEI